MIWSKRAAAPAHEEQNYSAGLSHTRCHLVNNRGKNRQEMCLTGTLCFTVLYVTASLADSTIYRGADMAWPSAFTMPWSHRSVQSNVTRPAANRTVILPSFSATAMSMGESSHASASRTKIRCWLAPIQTANGPLSGLTPRPKL